VCTRTSLPTLPPLTHTHTPRTPHTTHTHHAHTTHTHTHHVHHTHTTHTHTTHTHHARHTHHADTHTHTKQHLSTFSTKTQVHTSEKYFPSISGFKVRSVRYAEGKPFQEILFGWDSSKIHDLPVQYTSIEISLSMSAVLSVHIFQFSKATKIDSIFQQILNKSLCSTSNRETAFKLQPYEKFMHFIETRFLKKRFLSATHPNQITRNCDPDRSRKNQNRNFHFEKGKIQISPNLLRVRTFASI
jgi:hypothetical protein